MFNKLIEKLYFNQKGNLALYDQFTGCLNRNWFERFAETEKCNFVYVVDVNNLKATNDLMGHEAGDQLILSVANRIQSVSKNAKVIRYGGDEFYIFSKTSLKDELSKVQDKLFAFGESQRANTLGYDLKIADQAMYANKKAMKCSRRFA